MKYRVIQICPVSNKVLIARKAADGVSLTSPDCLAIIEGGAQQEVVYMELVDNSIIPVDIEDKDFIEFVLENDAKRIKELTGQDEQESVEQILSKFDLEDTSKDDDENE